jgi:hypothetical protein
VFFLLYSGWYKDAIEKLKTSEEIDGTRGDEVASNAVAIFPLSISCSQLFVSSGQTCGWRRDVQCQTLK